jgi:signal peptidase I
MSATSLIIGLFSLLELLQLLLWAVCLRFGLRWAKAVGVTNRRIALATAAVFVVQYAAYVALHQLEPTSVPQMIAVGLIAIAILLSLPWLLIACIFRIRFWRGAQAWLPTLIASATMFLAVYFVLRPYVCETFVSTSNSMAPTLLGEHWQANCPECQALNYCTVDLPPFGPRTASPMEMICDNFHVRTIDDFSLAEHAADRFVVAKFLAPQRWDIVAFAYPEDPSLTYVQRVVGMPGESVYIEDGSVWINGQRTEPPTSLRGLKYSSKPQGWGSDWWGTKEAPAKLGDDEYFVLGDFSIASADSRTWKTGVPGRSPFAVPASHLRGVVTTIYWPPERWRSFR